MTFFGAVFPIASIAWDTLIRFSFSSWLTSWRVGDDVVVPAEVRVLVLEGVEAVGALRDDRLHPHRAEQLDVGLRERLVQVRVADAPGPTRRCRSSLPRVANLIPRLAEDLTIERDTFFIRSS